MGLIIVTPLMFYNKQGMISSVPKDMRGLLFLRACLGACSLFFKSVSMYYLPLSQVVIIRNIYPFLASFFGYLINGEKVDRMEVAGLLICFVGIVLFTISKSQDEKQKDGVTHTEYLIGLCAIMTSAACLGLVTPVVRKMKKVHYTIVSNSVNMMNFGIFGTITLLNFEQFHEQRVKVPTEQFYYMSCAALILVFSLLLITQAQQLGKTVMVVMFGFL